MCLRKLWRPNGRDLSAPPLNCAKCVFRTAPLLLYALPSMRCELTRSMSYPSTSTAHCTLYMPWGFRNFRVSLRRFDIIFNTRQRCFTGTPRMSCVISRRSTSTWYLYCIFDYGICGLMVHFVLCRHHVIAERNRWTRQLLVGASVESIRRNLSRLTEFSS